MISALVVIQEPTPLPQNAVRARVRALALKRLERLKKKDRGDYIPAMSSAREYLRAGEQKKALSSLKLACEERNVYSLMIGSDPLYDPLRTDARFVKLLRHMKLN